MRVTPVAPKKDTYLLICILVLLLAWLVILYFASRGPITPDFGNLRPDSYSSSEGERRAPWHSHRSSPSHEGLG